MSPDHCGQRRQYATEIVTLARRLRDPALELLGRRLRVVVMLETGAIAEADAEMLAYRTVGRRRARRTGSAAERAGPR